MKKLLILSISTVLAMAAFAAGHGGGWNPGGNQPGGGGNGSFTFDTFIAGTTTNSYCLIREGVWTGWAGGIASPTLSSSVSNIVAGVCENCPTLKTINLSSTKITEIPDGAFAGCTNLTTVTLPSTCTKIGANAFAGCTALKSLTASAVTSVGADAFRYCTALTSVPSAVTTFGDYAFADSGVTSVSLASGMTLGEGVFANCESLATVTLASGVDTLPDAIFSGCTAITTTDWSGVTNFGQAALAGLLASTSASTVTLSDSADLGAYSFAADKATVALTLTNSSLPGMADYAFLGRSVSYTPVSGSVTAIEAADLVEWLLEEKEDSSSTVTQPADYNTATLKTWLGTYGASYVYAAELEEDEDFTPLTVSGTKFVFNEPSASGLCVGVEPVACNTLSSDESDWSFDNLAWSDADEAYVAADTSGGACFVRLRYTFDW